MEVKTIILISFALGFFAGWGNDKSLQNLYGKLTFIDHLIVPTTIIFVTYAFYQSIYFGFMAILQIILGTYIGVNFNRLLKKIFKK